MYKIRIFFRKIMAPTSGGVVTSKLVDGWCEVHTPVTLVDVTIWNFPWFFSEALANMG